MVYVRRRLEITEVSLVKRGANPGARVALHKREDERMIETNDDAPRWKLWAELKAEAIELRKVDQSDQTAIARYCTRHPRGKQLYARVRAASGPWVEPDGEPIEKDEPLPSLREAAELTAKVREANPELTEYQARVRMWKAYPVLRSQYEKERAGAIRKALGRR